MKFRCVAGVLLVCSPGFIAGCPDGTNYGFGPGYDGNQYAIVPDGNYSGNSNGTFQAWHWGDLYQDASGGSQSDASFWNGNVLKDSGQSLGIGDMDNVDYGAFVVSRQVYDVILDDWYYEVDYDVQAMWGSTPMSGTEYITFSVNSDGSLAMFDSLELTSDSNFDGGAWTFHATANGTLYPVGNSGGSDGGSSGGSAGGGSSGGGLSNPILDLKSGKMIIPD